MGVLVVQLDEADVDSCSDWLWQLGATAIEERTALEGTVALVVGFGHDDLALAARDVLGERWPCRFESTGDEATWRDEWMKWIEPIKVAGFVVHAPWHDPALWADWENLGDHTAELSIDPGRAFGSGHHPTTRLVLAALTPLITSATRFLDVGCGTGILSIAAAKLGAHRVLGIDLDHDILEVADANVEANRVAATVELRTDAVQDLPDRYDVVVANIVIGDLAPLMPALVERTRGVLVISGFLDAQLDQLLTGVDAIVIERTSLDGWACATLKPS